MNTRESTTIAMIQRNRHHIFDVCAHVCVYVNAIVYVHIVCVPDGMRTRACEKIEKKKPHW